MNPYDRRAWQELEAWRSRQFRGRARRLVPTSVRTRVGQAGESFAGGLRELPKSEEIEKAARDAALGAAEGLTRAALADPEPEGPRWPE